MSNWYRWCAIGACLLVLSTGATRAADEELVDLQAPPGLRAPPAAAPEPSVELTAPGPVADRSANRIAEGVVGATIGGGSTNTVAGDYGTVGGGGKNVADGYVATVGGGWENVATGLVSTVAGGHNNQALGPAASVGGGWKNLAGGAAATVPGGRNNTASGDYSLAAGRMAEARHPGSFVWSDSSKEATVSTGPDQFLIRAAGNVGIDVTSPAEKLTVDGNIAPAAAGTRSLGTAQLPWSAVHLVGGIDYRDALQLIHQGRTNLVVDGEGNIGTHGRIGVGTTEPTATLDVAGTLRIRGGEPGPGRVLTSDANGAAHWEPLPPPAAGSTITPEDFQFAPVFGPQTVQPLVLQTGGRRALRIEPGTRSPNLIGGSEANAVPPRIEGVTIAGGGTREEPNQVSAPFGAIGGGSANQVKGTYGVVAGGWDNLAEGPRSTVGGGRENLARGVASGVAGGFTNTAEGSYAAIGGGWGNRASGYVSTLAGGWGNTATGLVSTVGGGQENHALGSGATISGGWKNEATGLGATVPGGKGNLASGKFSVALGVGAQALHDGTFVWKGSGDDIFASTADDQFLIRAPGNVGIDVDAPDEKLTVAGAVKAERFIGDGSGLTNIPFAALAAPTNPADRAMIAPWSGSGSTLSDRNVKENVDISTVDIHGVAPSAFQGLHLAVQENSTQIEALERENRELVDRLDALENRLLQMQRRGTEGDSEGP